MTTATRVRYDQSRMKPPAWTEGACYNCQTESIALLPEPDKRGHTHYCDDCGTRGDKDDFDPANWMSRSEGRYWTSRYL